MSGQPPGHHPKTRPRDALERKGPQRPPQKRLDRRLEGVDKAVGDGYCRLPMPLKPAPGARATVAGHRLGALEGGGGATSPPFQCIPDAPTQTAHRTPQKLSCPPKTCLPILLYRCQQIPEASE